MKQIEVTILQPITFLYCKLSSPVRAGRFIISKTAKKKFARGAALGLPKKNSGTLLRTREKKRTSPDTGEKTLCWPLASGQKPTRNLRDADDGFDQTVRFKLCASLFPSYRKAGELTKTVMFLWTLQNDRPTNLPGDCVRWNFLFGRLLTSFQVAGRLSERTRTMK